MTKEDTHPQHKSNHAYLMHDNLNYPMVVPDWSAKDELQLIQGMMRCGVGNWKDVAEMYVKGGKTADECEEHFFTFYNRARDDCLPKEEDFIITQRFLPSSAATSQRNSSSQAYDGGEISGEMFELDEDK
jgi:hypothetical protein